MKSLRPAGTTNQPEKKTDEKSEERGRVKTRKRSGGLWNIVGTVLCTAGVCFSFHTVELPSRNSEGLWVKWLTCAAKVKNCELYKNTFPFLKTKHQAFGHIFLWGSAWRWKKKCWIFFRKCGPNCRVSHKQAPWSWEPSLCSSFLFSRLLSWLCCHASTAAAVESQNTRPPE